MFLQPTDDTKKLRRMLDENGVKWGPSMYMTDSLVDCETTWEFNGVNWYACESPSKDEATGRMSELDACVEVINKYLDGYKRIYESQREELKVAKSIGCDHEYIDDIRVWKHDTAVR